MGLFSVIVKTVFKAIWTVVKVAWKGLVWMGKWVFKAGKWLATHPVVSSVILLVSYYSGRWFVERGKDQGSDVLDVIGKIIGAAAAVAGVAAGLGFLLKAPLAKAVSGIFGVAKYIGGLYKLATGGRAYPTWLQGLAFSYAPFAGR